MRWNALWFLVPEQALLPLLLVGGGLLVLVGLMKAGRLLILVLGVVALPLLSPLLDAAFDALPWWLVALAAVALTLSMVKAVAALILGGEAANHMIGALAAKVVVGSVRFAVLLPVLAGRALVRWCRGAFSH